MFGRTKEQAIMCLEITNLVILMVVMLFLYNDYLQTKIANGPAMEYKTVEVSGAVTLEPSPNR